MPHISDTTAKSYPAYTAHLYVEDWRQLVESIMIDWNYDGVVMQPAVTDVPGKKEIVTGVYDIPEDAGTIKVKITDLLSESLEVEVE